MAHELGKVHEETGNPVNIVYKVALNQTTPFVIRSIPINHGEGGTIQVWCVGVDEQGRAVTGCKTARYSKSDTGVLTLENPQSDLAFQASNPAMNGCNFDVVKNNTTQNIDITVQGTPAAKLIGWQVTVNPLNNVSINAIA